MYPSNSLTSFLQTDLPHQVLYFLSFHHSPRNVSTDRRLRLGGCIPALDYAPSVPYAEFPAGAAGVWPPDRSTGVRGSPPTDHPAAPPLLTLGFSGNFFRFFFFCSSLLRFFSTPWSSAAGAGAAASQELNNSRPARQVRRLEFNQAMDDFTTMFPNMDYDIIECVLRANSGAVDATIDQLLQMNLEAGGGGVYEDSSDSEDSDAE